MRLSFLTVLAALALVVLSCGGGGGGAQSRAASALHPPRRGGVRITEGDAQVCIDAKARADVPSGCGPILKMVETGVDFVPTDRITILQFIKCGAEAHRGELAACGTVTEKESDQALAKANAGL